MKRRFMLLCAALLLCTTPGWSRQLDSLLVELGRRDQQVRRQTASMLTSRNLDTLLMAASLTEEVDSHCRATLYPLLDTLGWPTGLSAEANNAIWLILQHDNEALERYLPTMERAAARGAIDRDDYALTEDRINMNAGRPQRFGSQTVLLNIASTDVRIYLWPVADPERLDSLRQSVGLQPIDNYLTLFEKSYGHKAVWDPALTVRQVDSLRRGSNTIIMKAQVREP